MTTSNDRWTVRRRSCSTIYTHPDIFNQIIVEHNSGNIIWNMVLFDTVKEAKEFAENFYVVCDD